jgi:hypothetical protein
MGHNQQQVMQVQGQVKGEHRCDALIQPFISVCEFLW